MRSLFSQSREQLREKTRNRFGIPGPGEQSGRQDTDGWKPFGSHNQRAALTKRNQTIPETVQSKLDTLGQAAIDHIEYTLGLFPNEGSDDEILQGDIDLPFALSMAPREGGIEQAFPTNRLDVRVNSAGRDTHPQGRSGMDFLWNTRRLFPVSIQSELRPVTSGYVDGRDDRKAATLTRRHMFAAMIINLESSQRIFEANVKRILGEDEGEIQLLTLSTDAQRAWIALSFAGPGYARNAIRYLHDNNLDLNNLLSNEHLRQNFHVQGAIVSAARSYMLEELQFQEDLRRSD